MSALNDGRLGLRSLSNKRACATPTCVLKEIDENPKPVTARWSTFIIRPVHKHGPANNEVARDKTPEPAVLAVIAIVAHHEILVLRNYDLFAVTSHPKHVVREVIIISTWLVIHIVLLVGLTRWNVLYFKRVFTIVIYSFDLMFRQNLAIYDDVFAPQAYVIARKTDYALNIVR